MGAAPAQSSKRWLVVLAQGKPDAPVLVGEIADASPGSAGTR